MEEQVLNNVEAKQEKRPSEEILEKEKPKAEKVKEKAKENKLLIIGAIGTAIAGGLAVLLKKKKNKNKEE